MIREYEVKDTHDNMYAMSWTVKVILTDKRYGEQSVNIAQFGNKEDAELFVEARKELEAKAE